MANGPSGPMEITVSKTTVVPLRFTGPTGPCHPLRAVRADSLVLNVSDLYDLLEECLPWLRYCEGGVGAHTVTETIGKVKFVLKLAGREYE